MGNVARNGCKELQFFPRIGAHQLEFGARTRETLIK